MTWDAWRFGVAVCVTVVVAGSLVGCNTLARQPKFRDAGIDPAELKPGDSALITVKVSDKHDVVDRIVGVVQEDPRIKFMLKDDGAPPDKAAEDGVWTLQVDVPFMAPPGEFTLELTAYNARGDVVKVRSVDGEPKALSSTFPVVIQYPPEQ
jgi:hypothetical protein